MEGVLNGHGCKVATPISKKSFCAGGMVTVVVVIAVVVFAGCRDKNAAPAEETPVEEVAAVKEVAAHDSTINVHEYVDLGLSVKWATCNIGAERPENYGDYYAWGETRTKDDYSRSNCETYGKAIGDIGGTSRDVARVRWGGSWRMPTSDEIDELINNCDYEWTRVNGVVGGKFTSRKNGKSIFLPAAGMRHGTSLDGAGEDGFYWSSSPSPSDYTDAVRLYVGRGGRAGDLNGRSAGYAVRAVSNPDIETLRKSAAQGNAEAQYKLGMWYSNGRGVEQDYNKAMEWLGKSAAQGNAAAQLNIGLWYSIGQGVEQDYNKAMEWWEKSATQGNADAQMLLGISYSRGLGVEQDYNKAVEWLGKSAAQGNAEAQYTLGAFYFEGLGVEQDYNKATEWLGKSAAQGNAWAQVNLGGGYEYGYGVEQDREKAEEWYRKAAAQGNSQAIENLFEMEVAKDLLDEEE